VRTIAYNLLSLLFFPIYVRSNKIREKERGACSSLSYARTRLACTLVSENVDRLSVRQYATCTRTREELPAAATPARAAARGGAGIRTTLHSISRRGKTVHRSPICSTASTSPVTITLLHYFSRHRRCRRRRRRRRRRCRCGRCVSFELRDN